MESEFVQGMEAIDCKMNYELRINNIEPDPRPVATFMHLVIPHHGKCAATYVRTLRSVKLSSLTQWEPMFDRKNLVYDYYYYLATTSRL